MTEGKLKTPAGDVVKLRPYHRPRIYKNGDEYTGEIDRASLLPHGEGTSSFRTLPIGETIYYGMFKAGKYHGKGKLKIYKLFGENLEYEGNFVEGEREGWITVRKGPTWEAVRYERWEGGRCVEVI